MIFENDAYLLSNWGENFHESEKIKQRNKTNKQITSFKKTVLYFPFFSFQVKQIINIFPCNLHVNWLWSVLTWTSNIYALNFYSVSCLVHVFSASDTYFLGGWLDWFVDFPADMLLASLWVSRRSFNISLPGKLKMHGVLLLPRSVVTVRVITVKLIVARSCYHRPQPLATNGVC